MMTILDYFDDEISIILHYALLYGGCIGSSVWVGSGLGCGMAAMDNVVSCLGFFLFCSLTRGIAFLILLYPWVSATGLV